MTGDAEAARMGDAVAIAHQDIGRDVEHRQGIQQDRHFAERQQAGDIRKHSGAARHGAGDGDEILHAQNHHRAARDLAAIFERDIEPGDMFQRTPSAGRKPVTQFDKCREFFLQRNGLFRGEGPIVK